MQVFFWDKTTPFICLLDRTHAEYDKLCKKGEQYTINLY